jgi:hypothetical protein
MNPKKTLLLLLWAATGLWGCAAPETPVEPPPIPGRCATALEVIEKNLQAVGGRDRIQSIQSMIVKGATGSALLPPSEEVTLYLKKPDHFKQEGAFRVVLCSGDRFLANTGGTQAPISGGSLDELNYRIGYYHNGFSLLKWKDYFPTAELEEIKKYGPTEQYQIRLPAAEGGRDLIAYIDADTFLVDRLVYNIRQAGAGFLQVVNRLRDYQDFEGIQIPTRLVYDKVGWEVSPSHFLIREVNFDPELDENLFENADIDFGTVVCGADQVQGEIRGVMNGTLLTNVTLEDLTSMNIQHTDWVRLQVGDIKMEVKVLDNIQRSATEIKPDEIYLCTYPISGYPRLMLMAPSVDVEAKIPCKKGDALILSPVEKDNQ